MTTLFDVLNNEIKCKEKIVSDNNSINKEMDRNIECPNCSSKVSVNVAKMAVFGEWSEENEPIHWIYTNLCVMCKTHSSVYFGDTWWPIESLLSSKVPPIITGIIPVESYRDRLVLFVLSQIIYPHEEKYQIKGDLNQNQQDLTQPQATTGSSRTQENDVNRCVSQETENSRFHDGNEQEEEDYNQNVQTGRSKTEHMEEEFIPFLPPSPSELARILWVDGEAVGFYTFKDKGTQFSTSGLDVYSLPMLDTIYIRRRMRGQGRAAEMTEEFLDSHEGSNVGISEPISFSMIRVLAKLLQRRRDARDRLWACSYTGEEGYRSNVWFNIRHILTNAP